MADFGELNDRTTDVRLHLPSASGIGRLAECPGSWAMEKLLTFQELGEITERGTRIHNILADYSALGNPLPAEEEFKNLSEQDYWIAAACLRYEKQIVSEVFGSTDNLVCSGENRLFLGNNGIPILSGQYDKLYIDYESNRLLVVDYKTGYSAVADPAENLQLRTYAILVWKSFTAQVKNASVDSITVAVVQPLCDPKHDRCVYTVEDLQASERQILRIVTAAEDPNAPRSAGKHCEYCKAKAICPEFATFVQSHVGKPWEAEKEIIPLSTQELDIRKRWLSNDKLATMMNSASMVLKWAEAVKAEVKLRLRLDEDVPGWILAPGRTRRYVSDPYGVYQKMKDEGASPEQILRAANFSVEKLEALLDDGKIAKKDLKRKMEEILGQYIALNATDSMVQRKKE